LLLFNVILSAGGLAAAVEIPAFFLVILSRAEGPLFPR